VKIEDNTFSGCTKLSKITLPDSLTDIGNNAFSDCSNLKDVKLPSSVTIIGASLFIIAAT
jgi:hypothetical protein